jgi:hypothetical protein
MAGGLECWSEVRMRRGPKGEKCPADVVGVAEMHERVLQGCLVASRNKPPVLRSRLQAAA